MYDWHKTTGRAYLTSGIGYGKTGLSAFDAAERDANIISTNAVKVSSFVPPNWRIVESKEELGNFTDNGAFLPMAYAHAVSNRSKVAASLVIGINKDTTKASIIIEHADVNMTQKQSLEQSTSCLEEIFSSRGWKVDRLEKVAVEAAPKDSLYVCVLVAVVLLADQTHGYRTGEKYISR
jgi:pyruvoyl-dependent arginine decarboxylase